ncbi:LysE family translocator [Candidatus Atribacteria bacterium 1244-E10-H5-B2]|nr:MAG: LysE family translocator [Candidatus Atribacteria bacterium 1244-E10-H5-B2]
MNLIDFGVLIPFVLITTFTPGPNNLSCASMSINFGIKKIMNYIYGIVSGFFLLLLLCGFFSNLLLTAIPSVEPIMRWIGAAYILYLAYSTFKASFSFQEKSDQYLWGFYKGILLQFLNPKAIIYGLTLYSVFLNPLIGNPLYIILFSLGFALIGFCALLTWSLFGTIINQYLHVVKLRITINSVLSLLLAYTAIKISGILS